MFSKNYIQYLVHFHCDRDYFECHELLEEEWKKDNSSERKKCLVGLIQIAVALYHQRRGNFNGAVRMMQKAIDILNKEKTAINNLGLSYEKLLLLLEQRLIEMKAKVPYSSINLPIINNELLNICKKSCLEQQLTWGSNSNLQKTELIHRHKLRDRSDVMKERETAKRIKKQQQGK
ncbi:DUF309 domain-containing protein [Bacillus timonensis]|nr:DUF309 domain-containing protein [Bacillus timonensis]